MTRRGEEAQRMVELVAELAKARAARRKIITVRTVQNGIITTTRGVLDASGNFIPIEE